MPKCGQGIVSARSSVGKWSIYEIEFLFQSPHPEAEYQASIADAIKRSVTLGDLEGVVVAQHQHLGRQQDS